MTTAIRRTRRALAVALLLAPLALGAGAAQAAYVHEGQPEFEAQLNGGQISKATINRRLKTVRLTLTDGRHMLIAYHAGEEPRVRSQLEAKHVAVAVLNSEQAKAAKKPVHHKLRYIAGGILIAVIVVVGGVWLYNRRKRAAAE